MGQVKELNIKNQTYYYFDDIIDIRKFESSLLKIDKKSHRDFDIYYIGYNTIIKLSNCNCDCDYDNIHSVNPLHLIIHSATGYFEEKYDKKYLVIDLTEKYKEVLSETKSEIKTTNGGKELFYEKHYARIGVNTNDNVPLNKSLKCPT